jgi:hypothetical protein
MEREKRKKKDSLACMSQRPRPILDRRRRKRKAATTGSRRQS